MSQMGRHFPEVDNSDALQELGKTFVVSRPVVIFAMSARVGSTGLLSLLSRRFGFSDIYEILNPRGVADSIAKEHNLTTFDAYIRHIDRSLAGQILAFKVTWNDFEFLDQAGILESIFPNAKFIYLDRVDIEAQAVSLAIAEKTNVWHVPLAGGKHQETEIEYDRYFIDGRVRHLRNVKMSWMEFFGRKKIVPMTLYYEGIRNCAQHALLAICKESGIDGVTLDDMPDWNDGRFGSTTNSKSKVILERYLNDRYPRRPVQAVAS